MIHLEVPSLAGLDPAIRGKLIERFSAALQFLRDDGYDVLRSTDLEELESFRKRHEGLPGIDPPHTIFVHEHHPGEEAALGLFLARGNDLVGTVWRRIVPLRNWKKLEPLTLKQSMEGLHFFYADPGLALRRENVTVDCDTAESIRGVVCFAGNVWLHPDHQARGLFKPLATLMLISCVTSPDYWDWFITTVEERLRNYSVRMYPYKSWTRDMVHTRERRRDFWLVTASYREAVGMALNGFPQGASE